MVINLKHYHLSSEDISVMHNKSAIKQVLQSAI